MRAVSRACVPAMAAGVLFATAPAASAPQKTAPAVPAAFAQVLTRRLQFSSSDISALGKGQTVVKLLAAAEAREVAVAGAIWCNVPIEYFLKRARDIVTFKHGEEVREIGVIGSIATAAELRGLTLDAQDIEDLRKCAVGQCKVKLDLRGLERFRHEVGWSTPEAAEQANRVAREVVAGYIASYQRSGDSALVEYRDRSTSVSAATGTKALLGRMAWLDEAAPGLHEHADKFPAVSSPDIEDIIYWSKEAFGMKPTVSSTHMMVWHGTGGAADATLLSKQIFATHYFEASLSLTLLAADRRPDHAGVFVVYLNRSLVDLLQGGLLGPFRRSVAKSKTRDGLEDHLVALKKRLETDYKTKKN